MREFTILHSIEDIDRFVADNELAFLFVSSPGCSVCESLRPQVLEMMADFPGIRLGHADAGDIPAVAGHLDIFTSPVLLLYVTGKEYIREARIVHMDILHEKIEKIYSRVMD